MKILLNFLNLVGCLIICTLLALSWHTRGFSGAGKVLVALATVAIAIWATIWIGRCFYWLLTVMLAGIIILLETVCQKLKQFVLGQ
jgi:hypothetical protein